MPDDYRNIAPFYDTLVNPFMAPIRREACRVVRRYGFKRILDIGCGTGEQSILLSRLGVRVTGVDTSPSMLRVAREKSPATIEYFLENAAQPHFRDHSFDCVILSFSLHEQNPESQSLVLNEARRILTKQGKILLADFVRPKDFFAYVFHFFIRFVEWNAGRDHYFYFHEYMKRGGLEGLLREHRLCPVYQKMFYMGTMGLVLAGCADHESAPF